MFHQIEEVNLFFKYRQNLGIKPGLHRIQQLLSDLNHPEQRIKAIHIAGTNGKGSTIGFLCDALLANGYHVGIFTSPSMSGLTGHILSNKLPIADDIFIRILNQMLPSIERMDQTDQAPTEFEIITAISFVFFADHVDIALIETGMGGREDTTNCITPLLSLITNVQLDHTASLGKTLEQIAYHKAGIIKNNIPVILGEIQSDVLPIFAKEAQFKKCPLYRLADHFKYHDVHVSVRKTRYIWVDKTGELDVTLSMRGMHQVKNSALAIKALKLLEEQTFTINWHQVLPAIQQTQVEGRFEVITREPWIILDGAHNPAAIQSFLDTIRTLDQTLDKHLIFAAFKDKAIDQMVRQCMPYFESITLTSFHHSRAASVKGFLPYNNMDKVNINEDWKGELLCLLEQEKNNDHAMHFVTGSLNFVKQVRAFLLS